MSLLTRRFLRRALTRPNLTYYVWRYVANAGRTRRQLNAPREFEESASIADALRRRGIVVGDWSQFLSEAGQRACADAADYVVRASSSEDVVRLVRRDVADPSREKEFLVHLVSYPDGIPADDPLLAVALDRKLLESVAAYLGMWPSLFSVDA